MRYPEADWDPSWRRRAACLGAPAELFFEWSWSDRREVELEGITEAREVCAGCPVQEACLADALNRREGYGVRAGTTPVQRKRILRRRLDIPAALMYVGLTEPPATPAGDAEEER